MSQTLEFLRVAFAGERTSTGSSSSRRPRSRSPIVLAALRGKMLRLAVEKADGAFTNFLPLSALPKVTESSTERPRASSSLCRFFCLPGEREQVEPLARFMFASYATVPVYEAFFRWLGYGERIDEMVAAWKAKDREAAVGRRAVGPDRGHLHLRHARRDERAPRGLRRRAASPCRS